MTATHAIVVTEDMIEAGLEELRGHHLGDDWGHILASVYCAMAHKARDPASDIFRMNDNPKLAAATQNTKEHAPYSTSELSVEMLDAGVEALHDWLGTDDRFTGWDGRAVRDVFWAVYELYHQQQIDSL